MLPRDRSVRIIGVATVARRDFGGRAKIDPPKSHFAPVLVDNFHIEAAVSLMPVRFERRHLAHRKDLALHQATASTLIANMGHLYRPDGRIPWIVDVNPTLVGD